MIDNPPAFPSVEEHPAYDMPMHHFGMSLRDYFAGQALAAVLDDFPISGFSSVAEGAKTVATISFDIADAMLAARTLHPDDGSGE